MDYLNDNNSTLIPPYGGTLVNLQISSEEHEELRAHAATLPRLQLSARSVCDLELLSTGAFSPLTRFMGQADYERVLEEMRLADGSLFPVPITLPVREEDPIELDGEVTLVDQHNHPLAVMRVEELFRWNIEIEAQSIYGTLDSRHPLVAEMNSWGEFYVSGRLRVLSLPHHCDFRTLRLTPAEVRKRLDQLGHANVVAFQTRNPLHRAHEELTRRAAVEVDGTLLLHPVVGMTKPGDIDHFTRVRSYKVLAERYYDPQRMMLALLPLAMRMAGPREALWHAIIRRNFGANHLIVGRDHASPGHDSQGRPFYGTFDAQELVARHSDETGVRPVQFSELLYIPDEDRFQERDRIASGKQTYSLSGTKVREQYLQRGRHLPSWFTRPEVASILAEAHPPQHRRGFCLWFTGLSGAGKSTTADILAIKLLEHGRQVTVLDGDVVRTHLSKGLSFSKEDRDANIRRIGFVAAEIARHGGGVVCAAISPYRATRNECRSMVGTDQFIEIFVNTPLEVCEERDEKGMYKKARAGQLKNFTGVDDPYESPLNAEIELDTVNCSGEENADRIITYLIEKRFIQTHEVLDEEEETFALTADQAGSH